MGARRKGLIALGAVMAVLFAALGAWQVQRLMWKTALIAQVEARAHAAPVAAPSADEFDAGDDVYRAVRLRGRFDHAAETKVQAVTALGPGFWLMTPLKADRGDTVLINRGFIRAESEPARPEGEVEVTGLLRLTEPRGGFLRANDPAGDRWRSRDVQAIARARGVGGATAPYFVDAAASPDQPWPRGGLTVIRFTNNHLVYLLTWFGLSGMAGFFAWRVATARPPGDEA